MDRRRYSVACGGRKSSPDQRYERRHVQQPASNSILHNPPPSSETDNQLDEEPDCPDPILHAHAQTCKSGGWSRLLARQGPLSRAPVKGQGIKRNVVGDLQASAGEERETEGCCLDGDTGQD